jgi:hypothetical protein
MYIDELAAKGPACPVVDGLPRERRRWAVAAIFTALAMSSLDTAIANIALPAHLRRPSRQPGRSGLGGQCLSDRAGGDATAARRARRNRRP